MKSELDRLRATSWSLEGVDVDARWEAARGERSLRECVLNILLTRPGSRLMRPNFGVGLERWIHQPNNESTRRQLAEEITRALRRFEPRVQLLEVDVVPENSTGSMVQVLVRYRSRVDGSPGEVGLALRLTG